ncbi:PLP-dependent aminotransferase family protein [Mycetohabitans rhizoxinica]|uniref:MocR-like pyridoxine biosynthesis transcription factor PdxR n=1 Tax=Mycetohabitans rhizoxinica TaxID=412963 RepID=UPI0030CF9F50
MTAEHGGKRAMAREGRTSTMPAAEWACTLELDRRCGEPMYRQLVTRLREGILDGRLPAGMRLPSTRALATQLNTARGTVELAYELLAAEGFIETRGAAGTRVNARLPPQHGPTKPAPAPSADSASVSAPIAVAPLQMGLPALDLFPRKLWARVASHEGRVLAAEAFSYGDAQGQFRLRYAIAGYLAIARGIDCDPARIIITNGYHGALGLLMTALLPATASRPIWFEDPGYRRARDALRLAGAQLVGVPIDDEGLDVDAGVAKAPRACMAFVTPSHQAPLGVSLSLPRRLALLDWAVRANAWVVEDDYDGEFRYSGRPLPALASLDGGERVLYVGSFSKVLAPGLRLGYIVAPPTLAGHLAKVAALLAPPPALTLQESIAAFIEAGHFSRHIRRMRAAYAVRRDALAAALHRRVGGVLDISPSVGGMHLIGWLRECSAPRDGSLANDVLLARAAVRSGLAPDALSQWYLHQRRRDALLMSFTNVLPERADDVAVKLATAFERPYA